MHLIGDVGCHEGEPERGVQQHHHLGGYAEGPEVHHQPGDRLESEQTGDEGRQPGTPVAQLNGLEEIGLVCRLRHRVPPAGAHDVGSVTCLPFAERWAKARQDQTAMSTNAAPRIAVVPSTGRR